MKITTASAKAIRYACENFHYSGTVPAVQYGYNIYNDVGEWCGVVCFGSGATPRIGSPYGLYQGEILELVRVALNGKQKTTSQAVAAALQKLHIENPLVKMVISYADIDQGHKGIIYQATNWIYEGITQKGTRCAFFINGKRIHPRTVYSKGWKQSLPWIMKNIDPNAKDIIAKGKHKYIYCFDKKLSKIYRKKAKPYPKE